MALRQHLRADENLCITLRRQGQRFVHRVFQPCAIAVDSRDRSIWKVLIERLLQPFRSLAKRVKLTVALRTLGLDRPARAAVVAEELRVTGMHCHSRIASPAFGNVPAVRAY